ncbi:M20/M25/M40 family metallo-hydrolase [Acidimangrovimonas sediminis]|uniref:M20/M25/M40 family metallo-hydrolase n=1 Tax=Acidimangrovimonas sediminis TaxID=2056283 RepID=UPI000C7FCF59|nr:M20/M25/M40 family metallo-hydrolase [Acidimangrovimonas sediminis]
MSSKAPIEKVLSRIDADIDTSVERLMELMRIPSISTDPAYKDDTAKAADWLVKELTELGFDASVRPTKGHPMVVAHHRAEGPHILFYGHYDVQPVDPLKLWDRDPFDPAIEDTAAGKVIRGRGAADDKGQLMTFIEACRAYKAETGTLPGNLTLFFEGEEESGSPSMIPYLEAHGDELKCDLALICDTGLFESRTPAITTMLRGLAKVEFTVKAAKRDLHSGMYGGLAQNPIRVLTRILGGLFDAHGACVVPGFYDDVDELPDEVRAQWQALAFDHASFLGDVGLSVPAGEEGRTPLEMIWSRPTAEINGIWGGYTGAGFKTVLPSEASAKVSFRLVSRQDPKKILSAFHDWIAAQLPEDCELVWSEPEGSAASTMAISNPAFEAARQALTEEWGVPAAYVGCGGSIPIAGFFQNLLGMDTMLIGFGRDDDQIHSPNEKYDLACYHHGIRSWARILDRIGG